MSFRAKTDLSTKSSTDLSTKFDELWVSMSVRTKTGLPNNLFKCVLHFVVKPQFRIERLLIGASAIQTILQRTRSLCFFFFCFAEHRSPNNRDGGTSLAHSGERRGGGGRGAEGEERGDPNLL